MKPIEDMTFGEIFERYAYPEYLKLRKSCNLPLTPEQEAILEKAGSENDIRGSDL